MYRKRAGPAPQPLRQPLVRLDVDLGGTVSPNADRAERPSVRGWTRLVYVSESKLFTRQFDQADSTELPGTERAEGSFLFPRRTGGCLQCKWKAEEDLGAGWHRNSAM